MDERDKLKTEEEFLTHLAKALREIERGKVENTPAMIDADVFIACTYCRVTTPSSKSPKEVGSDLILGLADVRLVDCLMQRTVTQFSSVAAI